MALLRRLDAFDVTFPDCSARSELKISERKVHRDGRAAKKGVGEKRLYVGHNEEELGHAVLDEAEDTLCGVHLDDEQALKGLDVLEG